MIRIGTGLLAVVAATTAACGGNPSSAPEPEVPPAYAALADTMVCVVDPSAPEGLSEVPAKVDGGDIVVLDGGEIVPLATVHPVNVIAGYAGAETWLRRGEPIRLDGSTYVSTGGERRVGIELLARVGEHEGILLFAGREDPSPADALYIPTAPGCIFQPYVRDDLLRD